MGGQSESVELTLESIEEFIDTQRAKGLRKNTVTTYRTHLLRIYRFLPFGEKCLRAGTIKQIITAFQERGLSVETLNIDIRVCNLYLEYHGRRDLQYTVFFPPSEKESVCLTRSEYQRLLLAARQKNKEREYLMVKVFAVLGIRQIDLERVTAEAVEAGEVAVENERIRIPPTIRKELLTYIKKRGITSGPIFISRRGTPYSRQRISSALSELCDDAHVERSKGTSRNLRLLCDSTMTGLRDNMEQLIQQAYDRIIDMEQLTVAWDLSEQPEMQRLGTPKRSGQYRTSGV